MLMNMKILMQVILSVRQACRDQKQWALADCIRDRLAENRYYY